MEWFYTGGAIFFTIILIAFIGSIIYINIDERRNSKDGSKDS